jgi:glycerol-3-phosphate dehydrogenase (NAD(P)+)
MDFSVIGSGRWGSFLAWYLHRGAHRVVLYGRPGSARAARLAATRSNGILTLPPGIELTDSLERALAAEVVLISIPSQSLRGLMAELRAAGLTAGKLLVLCMKGLETGTGKRLSQVAAEGGAGRVAVWLGPGHVQEFVREVPNCMVIDAGREADKRLLVDALSGELIRFYYGEDMIGNEVGAAAKNVVGLAAGMLDGFGLGSLKGALMSRGTREYARLVAALGGNPNSAYGLCHLGDYEATVFSRHSRNRMFGERFVKGEAYDELAEGCHTASALMELGRATGVELPISEAVYRILYEGLDPLRALDALFSRRLKQEFN